MLRIEIVSDRPDQLGEGPLWDVGEQRLYWIDSYGPAIHCCDAAGGDRKSWSLPEPIGSMALREKGGAVLSLRDGFYAFDFATGETERIVETQPGELRPGEALPASVSPRARGRLRLRGPWPWRPRYRRAAVQGVNQHHLRRR